MENDSTVSQTLSAAAMLLFSPHIHSHFIAFHSHHRDSICHTITMGTDGRYLVVLVEVVGFVMLTLGVLMVA